MIFQCLDLPKSTKIGLRGWSSRETCLQQEAILRSIREHVQHVRYSVVGFYRALKREDTSPITSSVVQLVFPTEPLSFLLVCVSKNIRVEYNSSTKYI